MPTPAPQPIPPEAPRRLTQSPRRPVVALPAADAASLEADFTKAAARAVDRAQRRVLRRVARTRPRPAGVVPRLRPSPPADTPETLTAMRRWIEGRLQVTRTEARRLIRRGLDPEGPASARDFTRRARAAVTGGDA